jgi:hypothetical protein
VGSWKMIAPILNASIHIGKSKCSIIYSMTKQHWIQLAIFCTWTLNQPLIPTNISWRINSIPHDIIFINVPKLSHTFEGSSHEISLCTTSSTTIYNHKICNVLIIDLKVNCNSTNTTCFHVLYLLSKKNTKHSISTMSKSFLVMKSIPRTISDTLGLDTISPLVVSNLSPTHTIPKTLNIGCELWTIWQMHHHWHLTLLYMQLRPLNGFEHHWMSMRFSSNKHKVLCRAILLFKGIN